VSESLPLDQLLVRGPDDADWRDVVRRADRGRRRRQGSLVLAGLALLSVGIAAAYAAGHPIVDFSKAPKGPRKVVNDFGSLEVGAPPGMAPGVLPHQARRITAVTIERKPRVLWVAPTEQGGFCYHWSGFIAGCRVNPHDVQNPFAKRLEVSGLYHRERSGSSVVVQGGSFFQKDAARLEMRYADGTSDEIPFVWVSAPINAGFYLFRVPDEHRRVARRPKTVRLYDGSGKVLASEPASDAGFDLAGTQLNLHRLPGYSPLSVPTGAIWEKRRQLFDLRADDGTRIGLWVAPSRTGGTCYWSNQTSSCPPPGARSIPSRPLELGLSGGATHVSFCCTVGKNVVRVEARFEDGDRIELTPKEGYLVWPVPARHYPHGHRVEELVAFDASGREIASQARNTREAGVYPCKKPKDIGYGYSMCP
jgi:hypothetical protein